MKTILCFGDSNTWGWNPITQQRFPRHIRWTGVLQCQLGNEYHVIEEGLCGRTTLRKGMFERYTSGKEYLIPCLSSHKPINLVIIMLGTNDLKHRFAASALNIAKSAEVLVKIVQRSKTGANDTAPTVLLIAPPPIRELADYGRTFRGAETKSKEFGRLYEAVAQSSKCAFLDAAKYITSSNIDGIHLDANEHLKLGEVVTGVVREIFQNEPVSS